MFVKMLSSQEDVQLAIECQWAGFSSKQDRLTSCYDTVMNFVLPPFDGGQRFKLVAHKIFAVTVPVRYRYHQNRQASDVVTSGTTGPPHKACTYNIYRVCPIPTSVTAVADS